MKPELESLASLLDRPVDQLQMLDRRPLALAFVPGSFVTYVLRDRSSGATLELTLDVATGRTVEPAALRQLDRSQGAARGEKLSVELLSLVLRHASLEAIPVAVDLSPPAALAGDALNALSQERFTEDIRRLAIELPAQDYALEPTIRLTLSVPQIVGLAASPWVRAITLAGEPEIPDQAE